MAGIKETLEVIDFGIAVSELVVKSMKDGKIGVEDVQHIFPVILAAGPAFSGIGELKDELSDLSAEELAKIRDHVLAKMPNLGDKWMITASEALKIAISVYNIIEAHKSK